MAESFSQTFGFTSFRPLRWLAIAIGLLTFIHFFDNAFQNTHASVNLTKPSFDWATLHPHHPVSSVQPLPTQPPHKLRRIQHIPGRPHNYDIATEQHRCKAVKVAAEKAWRGYRDDVGIQEGQTPMDGRWPDPFNTTVIDTLDMLWIMGLKKEFNEAIRQVAGLDWSTTHKRSIDMLDTTTRLLAGLMSAYDLSKEPVLLTKAQELGDLLYMGFDTPNHLPPSWLDLEKAKKGEVKVGQDQTAASVVGLILEFTRLSQLTGDNKYYSAVASITDLLHDVQNQTKLPGMWPTHFNVSEAIFHHENTFNLGANSGAMYEYILKMHSLLRGADERYEEMYHNMTEIIINSLLFRPMTPKKLDVLFPGTFRVGDKIELESEIGQAACFAGGMFALGGRLFNISEHVTFGARLTNGCMWAFSAFPHNLMPENFKMVRCDSITACKWNEEKWLKESETDYDRREHLPMGFLSSRDPSYSLRPEAIESMFVMYRITGHEEYREAAWNIFQSIQKATKTETGFARIADVSQPGSLQQRGRVEIFRLASTLKYFYLMFASPDLISLDEFVFNTEGHPFRIPKS